MPASSAASEHNPKLVSHIPDRMGPTQAALTPGSVRRSRFRTARTSPAGADRPAERGSSE